MQRLLCNGGSCQRYYRSNTTSASSALFREHIRSYNSAASFASLGAKILDLPFRDPYVFKIHGQTYHLTSLVIIKAAQTAIRDYFNHIMRFGKLSCTWRVTSFKFPLFWLTGV